MSQPRSKNKADSEVMSAIFDLSYGLLISNDSKIFKTSRESEEFINHRLDQLFSIIKEKKKQQDQTDFINLKTNSGHTAIYYAVKMGHFAAFERLIRNGADLEIKYDGLTLRDIVKQELIKNPGDSNYKQIDNVLSGKKEINNKKYTIEHKEHNEKLLKEFEEQIQFHEKRSQTWIKRPLQQQGYKKSGGFCLGVAQMAAQAFLLTERDKDNNLIQLDHFAERVTYLSKSETIFQDIEISQQKRILLVNWAKMLLNKVKPEVFKLSAKEQQMEIEKVITDPNYRLELARTHIYKENPGVSLPIYVEADEITNMIGLSSMSRDKNLYTLSDKDKMNLEMESFFNGVEIYQQIYEQPDLTSKKWKSQTILPGMDLVPNLALEKEGGAVVVDYFSSEYNQKELSALFSKIEEISEKAKKDKYQEPIVLVLGTNNHAITIGYDPIKKAWRNIDANRIDRVNNYYSSSDIARVVQDELIKENVKNLEINIMSTAANADNTKEANIKKNIIDPLHNSPEWKNKHGKIGFFTKNKKNMMYAVGGILLGAAFLAGAVLTAGILPLITGSIVAGTIMTGVMLGIGTASALGGFAPMVKSAIDETVKADSKTSKEQKIFKKHLKTSVKAYKKREKQEEIQEQKQSFKPSTSTIAKSMNMEIKQEEKLTPKEIELITTQRKEKTVTTHSVISSPAIEFPNIKEEKESPRSRIR